jgi:hypothetical protein
VPNVYAILAGIDPRLPWPGMLVVMAMAAMAGALYFAPAGFGVPWVRQATRWCGLLLGVLALAQLGLAVSYFFYPRYLDWIEPTIIAGSWIGLRGGQFYTSLTGGDISGVWYGPMLFHLNGLMLWLLGPSIESSKVLGELAFFGALYLSFRVLRRAGASQAEAVTLTAIQCLILCGFANQASAFGIRTEPLLVLAAECAVFAATSRPGFAAAAIMGVLTGLMANLKIQGVFFNFPIFVFFMCQAQNNIRRLQLFGVAAAAGAAGLLLPFAPPDAAPLRYLALFTMGKHFAIQSWILQKNIVYLMMLWSPAALLYGLFRPRLPFSLLCFVLACIPAMGMVTMAASIEGGGSYNYLTFLPALSWFLLRLIQTIGEQFPADAQRLRRAVLGAMVAFLVGFTPNLAIAWYPIMTQYKEAPNLWRARAQIDAEMKAHPGKLLQIGPGRYADLRVIPVFHGNPLAIDSETWYDLRMGGIDEDIVRRLIRTCRMDTWMHPANGPIFHENNEPKLYSPEFIAEFRAHYREEISGGVLNPWRCVDKD